VKKIKPQVLSPLEGYNLWAATYQSESNPIKDLSDSLVKKFLPHLQGKSVLDCGCGTGKFCTIAEEQNAYRIVGLDLSPSMIRIAKQNHPKTEFICADITEVELEPNAFDVCISALMMAHLEHLEPPLKKMLHALKKDGIIILTDFHPFLTLTNAKRTFHHDRSGKSYEVRHFLHLFESYFKVFADQNFIVEKFEEPVFNNTPVVFGIRARKK
jgi:malonyl-CoA O-methyltransferase